MSTITSLPTTPISALPTPPFTPAVPTSPHVHLLGALIVHYQRERMWVKNTQDMISVARQQLQQPPLRVSTRDTNNKHSGVPPLWQRRKSRRSLRLSDIPHSRLPRHLLTHDAYGIKILDLFAALLDARIESCKRMETLVIQSAHPRSYHR